ncbi:uncharacterized protein LOC130954533 [Arachis stenosperma]|uniref:uncharacterized protein LOC130954533 n=1 Tax=Arachis stenosperma TaxID=217475 RepID=UPI0025AD6A7D|nr:uncharacterized protein LOC130954533 [Arachis stenosperma]
MLCSAPTAKSGSTWLDRLRSSKGIPTGDGLDLDSFLLTAAHHSPRSLQARSDTIPARARPTEAHHEPPSMTAVLAELFNMGATLTRTLPSKKCPRKQTHPKFFLANSSPTTTAAATTTTAAATAIRATNSLRANVTAEEVAVIEEEALDRGDDEDNELMKGFTKSEVTMIDTSFPGWKVDKLVFRKNNIWKVRERKHKSKFFTKKKKKTSDVNGIGSSKDNAVNMKREKPMKDSQGYIAHHL